MRETTCGCGKAITDTEWKRFEADLEAWYETHPYKPEDKPQPFGTPTSPSCDACRLDHMLVKEKFNRMEQKRQRERPIDAFFDGAAHGGPQGLVIIVAAIFLLIVLTLISRD